MLVRLLALVAVLFAVSAPTAAAQAKPTIVLVHGAGSLVGPETLVTRPYPVPGGEPGTDLYLSREGFRTGFAGDLPRRVVDAMWARQRPLAAAAFAEPSGDPRGRRSFLVPRGPRGQRAMPAAAQRFMAQRAGARTVGWAPRTSR